MKDVDLRAIAQNAEREDYWQRVENGAMQIAAAILGNPRVEYGLDIRNLRDRSIDIAMQIVQEIDRRNVAEMERRKSNG